MTSALSGDFSVSGAELPIRIRFEHTLYPHWGRWAGYVQVAQHFDRAAFAVGLHGTPDDDSDVPAWLSPLRPVLKRWCRRSGMRWYKVSDLTAEARIFGECIRGSWDIVHLLDGEHSGRYLPGLLKLGGRSSLPVIATFHQPPEVAEAILDGELLRRLDHLIIVSPTQAEFFGQFVPAERLHLVLHGVDTSFFAPGDRTRANARLKCLTVGNWLRDWDTVRAVATALPEIDFEIVTGANLGLMSANVTIRSGLDDDRLASLYRSADVLFLPLLGATANNALLEGVASGLPVVSSDIAAVRAYLPGTEAILVSHADDFVAALRLLQADEGLRSAMAAQARVRAEELSWPRIAKLHQAIYERALGRLAPIQ
ncbi:MAG: glycosyltransferase family 4 protein [Mesorhizobium sp.]|nr:MAG: glycosyltransferase family 4 protein [Mesorhizobium sp.]